MNSSSPGKSPPPGPSGISPPGVTNAGAKDDKKKNVVNNPITNTERQSFLKRLRKK